MNPETRRPRVTYFDDNRVVDVEAPDQTILSISQLHRIPHMSECGGHARVHGDVIVERIIRSPADAARMRAEESDLQRGRELSLATLFCDLRGFTPLTERHLPYDVVYLLNRYFEAVGEPILNNNGYIDMYVGDAAVASAPAVPT